MLQAQHNSINIAQAHFIAITIATGTSSVAATELVLLLLIIFPTIAILILCRNNVRTIDKDHITTHAQLLFRLVVIVCLTICSTGEMIKRAPFIMIPPLK